MSKAKEDSYAIVDALERERAKQLEAIAKRKQRIKEDGTHNANNLEKFMASQFIQVEGFEHKWLQVTGFTCKLTKREDYLAVVTGARVVYGVNGGEDTIVAYSNMAQGTTMAEAVVNVMANLYNLKDWKPDDYAARSLAATWEMPVGEIHKKK